MKACLIALPALLGTALTASAADFTFNVPAELHGLRPEVTQVRVNCQVKSTPTFTTNPFTKIGSAISPPQPVANGEFNGVIAVEVNASADKDPSNGHSYRCDLHLYADGAWFIPSSNSKYPLDPGKPSKIAAQGQISH